MDCYTYETQGKEFIKNPTIKMKYKLFLVIVTLNIVVMHFMFSNNFEKKQCLWKNSTIFLRRIIENSTSPTAASRATEIELKIYKVLSKIDQLVPNVTFTNIDNTTSARNSRATLLNPKDKNCIRDTFTIQIDMYDYMGNRKKYGGDFVRARIYSPELKAGASGKIEDLNNGSYLVHFNLSWEGRVHVSLLLFHPSEGVSALWRTRNKGYKNIVFTGKFANATHEAYTECGFDLNSSGELCKYLDKRDEESFYCLKPPYLPCESFIYLHSKNRDHSYLEHFEKPLFHRSRIGVEIPRNFKTLEVSSCNRGDEPLKEKCKMGMQSPYPSGYFLQSEWNPHFCKLSSFRAVDEINACLRGKTIHFLGDSTLRQWMMYLTNTVKTLKLFDLYGSGQHKELLALDMDRNIKMQWKKHGHPFVTQVLYTVKGNSYIPRELDHLAGGSNTVVVVKLGQHFRPFPLHIFIKRVINIRHAIERLFLRSPDTKVVLDSENIREMDSEMERFSDFHGYVQYLALKDVFQGLNLGIIDAWDMTIAFAANSIHPPEDIVRNQVNMFLTYIC
ncbi:NXPE family member 1-like isoform X2 [Rhinatrema bivittatum]|uniref:NXPE family member 1-like isoform X2 n=1 Tax=Rhinatrema bivittatum TaxID=194408 RepID=UPI00112BF303|nr:NXPE family member 1-like isoform X2 [Rhinatrema bivittatum]